MMEPTGQNSKPAAPRPFSVLLMGLAAVFLTVHTGLAAALPTVTVLTATAASAPRAEDPCLPEPDRIRATGRFSVAVSGSVSYAWCVVANGVSTIAASGTLANVPKDTVTPAPALDYTRTNHLPHQTYTIQLKVTDKTRSTGTGQATATVNNLPPVVFPLRWHRSADPCVEVTDTPATHTHRTSLVAAPAVGTEASPGIFLNVTAAACDPDGDLLKFTYQVDGQGRSSTNSVLFPDPALPTLQTNKLSQSPLDDAAGHTLRVHVDDSAHRTPSPDPAVDPVASRTATTPAVAVSDPREELRRELAGLGFSSIEQFQAKMGAALERAQADFRIQSGGTAPMTVSSVPPLMEGRAVPEGRFPGVVPDDLPLLRLDEWVLGAAGVSPQQSPPAPALSPQAEARGEYFAALLNTEAGLLRLNDVVDLTSAPRDAGGALLPVIYRTQEQPGGHRCFPRSSPADFSLPPQAPLDLTLDVLHQGALDSLFPPGPLPPDLFRDLADTGRLFSAGTANLFTIFDPPSGPPLVSMTARHRPDIPRVRVHAAVNDGLTAPVVCWTFTDPACTHSQDSAEVNVGGQNFLVGPGVRSVALAPLAPGAYTAVITVYDSDGRSASRRVPFVIPAVP